MFLLDRLDWSEPLGALLSVVFFLVYVIFFTLGVISAVILLINQLFGWSTYPEDKEQDNDRH